MDNSEVFLQLCEQVISCESGTDIESLLVKIRDINEVDDEGHPPMWYATLHNPNLSVIRTLITAGSVITIDSICQAVINNPNPEVALELYRQIPQISQADKNLFFLLAAAAQLDDRLVRFFHKEGADSNTTMPMDLYLADRDDDDDIDVDEVWLRDEQSVEQNAIVVAIYENPDPVSMVKTLLELGVNPNVVDAEGYPVIIHAMDNAELVQVLLDGGVDPQSTDCHGMTPLMHACAADINDVALLLLQHTKNIQAKSNTGETALHYALGCHLDNNIEVVQALIEAGSNVNEPDGDGLLPLDIARFNYCSEEIISLLLKAGALMGEVS